MQTEHVSKNVNSNKIIIVTLVTLLIFSSFIIGYLVSRNFNIEIKNNNESVQKINLNKNISSDTQIQVEKVQIPANKAQELVDLFLGKPVNVADYIYGDKTSDVIVVEYLDPGCPYCVQFSSTIKQLREEYKNKVSFVYRYFPLIQIHPNAFDESRAMACSGKIGGEAKYYEYIDKLFNYKLTNKTTELTVTGKEDIAKEININMVLFNTCMTNKDTEQDVTDSLNDGVAAGVEGTPATFVLLKNSKGYEVIAKIDGARQYSFVKAAIEQALTR